MTDASVEFLLNNLTQLAVHHYTLISGARKEVDQLTDDLKYFKAVLKYVSSSTTTLDDVGRALVDRIRKAVNEAEDVVDTYVTQTLASKSKSWFGRLIGNAVRLDDIALKVQDVRKQLERAYGDKKELESKLLKIGEEGPENDLEGPMIKKENIVGFEDEAATLIGYLNEKTDRLDIISIVGMPGLGKSTLAWKIFRDPSVEFEFPTRLWVHVSKLNPKDVFLNILRELTTITEDMHRMSARELANRVSGHLDGRKFLIVMDDVWTPEEWSAVAKALPASNHQGKILITSRFGHVALSANGCRDPHKLRFMNKHESWKLLQYEAFGKPECPDMLKDYGIIISEKCNGLPLAIVVIGGILRKKLTEKKGTPAVVSAWSDVSEKVSEYLRADPEKIMEKIISLSYDRLPYHLKPCFLYLGMFPKEIEIPAWKLFRMWIAEGFVQQETGFSYDDTAERYLEELISRNLVRVDKRNSYGNVKTCRIHDSLRDFCKDKAGINGEKFFEEISKSSNGGLEPVIVNDTKYRRLCIHSGISTFLSSKPSARHVRSLVSFSNEEIALANAHAAAISAGFKMLRVLDIKPVRLPKLTSDLFDLLHLRYIHISTGLKMLPRQFSDLWNVQTLIVDTTERELLIKADIWKMRHLGYFKTNAIAALPEPTADGKDGGENKIQKLCTISTKSCTNKVLSRACNLKRVSIRGLLKELLDGSMNDCSFDSVLKLSKLEKLKLQNDPFPKGASEGHLSHLPPYDRFPPNLKKLTLSATQLQWSQIKGLASLPHLEVLKLKEKAFTGDYWNTDDCVFRHLKVLFIGHTDLALWQVSKQHFPSLMHLELHNCFVLRDVPIEFAEVQSLNVLVVHHCGNAAATAKKIQDLKKADGATGFELSLLPPIN